MRNSVFSEWAGGKYTALPLNQDHQDRSRTSDFKIITEARFFN
jgi:hypothetical protein